MSNLPPEHSPELVAACKLVLQQAQKAFREGDRLTARRLAAQAAALDPGQEDPWLLLAALAEPHASLGYLQRALEINPESMRALKGIKWAQERLHALVTQPPTPQMPPIVSLPAAVSRGGSVAQIKPLPGVDHPPIPPAASKKAAKPQEFHSPSRLSRLNWALIIGLVVVLGVFAIAILGPRLAPHDPLQEKYVFFLPDKSYIKPPIAAFRMPEFPLGTDEYGRDIFSRLLWAVGPSLRIVLLAASLRIILGVAIGLAAGWYNSRVGRALDTLISAGLTVPVIFVALFVIALTGLLLGMWAFVLGLFITGWAEVARIIKEQTYLVKRQAFIEAAVALGASSQQIILRHIVPQVVPLVWISLVFEVSSSLMTLAGLGFLGYFINSIWVPLADWSALRTSGTPELGQMLSTSASHFLNQPYSLLAAGGMIFLIVLGFNLLGEGLRWHTQASILRRRKGVVVQTLTSAGSWLEERWLGPLSPLRRNGPIYAAVGTLTLLIVVGSFFIFNAEAPAEITTAITVPGGHLWAMERHDAQGTNWVPYRGPEKPEIVWAFESGAGFSGSPVVAADGTIYLAGADAGLYAVSPEGKRLWRAALPAAGFGTPAIGPSGRIYVVDVQGGISAYSPSGSQLWTLPDSQNTPALRGPIVSSKETVYYPTQNDLVAVNSAGEQVWRELLPTFSYAIPIARLSNDEKYLFFEDTVLDRTTGDLLQEGTFEASDRYEVSVKDGQTYLTYQGGMRELVSQEDKFDFIDRIKVDLRGFGLVTRLLQNAGVTGSGRYWMYYASGFEYGRLIWMDAQGVPENPIDYPYIGESLLVGIDQDDTLYMCGIATDRQSVECRANRPGTGAPLWKLEINDAGYPIGGAIVPGRIYVTTLDGNLYAIEDLAQ